MLSRQEQEELYNEHVEEHYESPYHRGHCAHPTHAHEGNNPMCGDEVRVELRIGPSGQVEEAWFEGRGCRISQAAASMLVQEIEGKSVDDVKGFGAQDMLSLFKAKLTSVRQNCCLLSWRVVQSALHAPVEPEKYEGTATNSPG